MQFKVPQFLEIEDKIFGPFTFRQFVYLVGGLGLCFILYRLLGLWIGAIPILLIGGFCLASAFYRPNDKPFIEMFQSMAKFAFQNKLYIWKKDGDGSNKREVKKAAEELYGRPNEARLSQSRLRDLAWSLDVLDLSKHKNSEIN